MKKFRKFLIVMGILIIVMLGTRYTIIGIGMIGKSSERTNTECLTEERVFDYADVLTDRQEEKLRNLIDKRQKQLGMDIVIVTINEDVGSDYDHNNMMYFADDFFDYYKFGWDQPIGSGVVYADNWYAGCGFAESWLSAAGKAYPIYGSQSTVNQLIDRVCEYVNVSPYWAYRAYINQVTIDMTCSHNVEVHIKDVVIVISAFIIMIIFCLFNLGRKSGKKTTNMSTYVQGGSAKVLRKEDTFISKSVTSRHIDTSSGGGHGGGGHSSGGGGSHSGGGGRH